MSQTSQTAFRNQRLRLHSADASLRQSRFYLSRYREEIARQYQSDEVELIIAACNQCMETINDLMERCDLITQRLQWLERLTI